MKYVHKIFRPAPISTILICFIYILFGSPALASAYTAAEIDARIPDARNQIVNTENACFSNLVTENGKPGTSRDHVNNSNPYRDISWVSPRSAPTQTSVTVASGTRTVDLQLNKMLFVCAALVDNNITAPSDIDDASSIVTNGNFANDRKPTSTNLNPDTHKASLTGVNTRINSASVTSGGGSVNVAAGSTLPVPRDNNSRYWFAGPVNFTYDAGAPMTTTRTITILFNLKDIRSYGATHQCARPGGGSPLTVSSNSDFGPCGSVDTPFSFTIVVNGGEPIGTLDAVNCDKTHFLTGWAFDPDRTSQSIRVHIYVNAPSGAPGAIGPGPGAQGTGMADRPSDGGTSPPSDVNGAYGISGQHRFDIPFSALNAAQQTALNAPGSHNVYVYGIGVNSSGAVDNINSLGNGITGSPKAYDPGSCAPPAVYSCGNVSTNPSPAEPGAPFDLLFDINASNGSGNYNYSATMSMSGPGSVTGPSPATISGSGKYGSAHRATFSGLKTNTAGDYSGTITVTITSPKSGSATCSFSVGGSINCCKVANKPYFKVSDGDVAAGPTCTSNKSPWYNATPPANSLTAWNDTTKGAGTNLAVLALNTINGFASSQGLKPQNWLSFANTGANPPVDPTYGGGFPGIPCPPDYYSKASGINFLPPSPPNPLNSVPDNNTAYSLTGPITLNSEGSVSVNNGNRPAIFVNGDVSIDNNITLNSGNTLNALSSFYLVVKGNIYISSNVSELDGIYIAQPGGGAYGGGKIYTCYGTGNNKAPTAAELNGACKNHLTVRGAFIAQELKLYRSGGTLSTGPEAELFIYNPALWLVAPCVINDSCDNSNSSGGYDAITSLPPIL